MSMREGVAVPTGLTTGNVQRRVAREHEVRIWGSHDVTLHASDRFPEITGKSLQEISEDSTQQWVTKGNAHYTRCAEQPVSGRAGNKFQKMSTADGVWKRGTKLTERGASCFQKGHN
jgi:hypothetical protein